MADADVSLLEVRSLRAGYGKKEILRGVSLNVRSGEIVAVVGSNGAGKSTFLKAVFGLIPIWSGEVLVEGVPYPAPKPIALLSRGVAYVPQGNRAFGEMTVRENLEIGGHRLRHEKLIESRVEGACARFAELGSLLHRTAGSLSGGERQVVALAMGLMTAPRLVLLDEPTLGLSPLLARRTFALFESLARQDRVAMLVVEQRVRDILRLADRVVVLRNGEVSFSGLATELGDDARLRATLL